MRSPQEIRELLVRLDQVPADRLETQDLDFKEWITRSREDAVAQVVEMAVCMANGGGGSVVFGVRDGVVGRAEAIPGVPLDVDPTRLLKAVYDSTDPKLTPQFENLVVPEGSGRLLLMQVLGGLPPYTDTQGRGKVRVGKDCQPLTGTLRGRIMVETGESDYSAVTVNEPPESLVSPSAMERLRDIARQERAADDLLAKTDLDLLGALEVLADGRLNRAGVFLAGKESAVARHLPNYGWTHLRMRGDTDYSDRADGRDALPIALWRLEERINADNPIDTVEVGFFHFEYRAYPARALREALMNALCHGDFRLASPILVKQHAQSLEITNPGGFIAGITPANILHHTPAARNPALVEALARLRLVNRSNLGVGRMFEAMLIEGKEPPGIADIGQAVRLVFRRQPISAPFRAFIAEEERAGRRLDVDQLILLRYLLEHREVDTASAAELCQRGERDMLGSLDLMAREREYLHRGGTGGRGAYFTLAPELHRRLAGPGHPERDRRIDWEAAKTRVLSVLMERARRGEAGLTNAEVRAMTHYNRLQVNRLVHELEAEGVRLSGHGRGARYTYRGGGQHGE